MCDRKDRESRRKQDNNGIRRDLFETLCFITIFMSKQ